MKDMQFQPPVFFCAGEPSGDVYAGLFVKELEGQFRDAKILGVGDGNMEKSGIEIVSGYEGLATFGLSDAFSTLVANYSCYRKIARKLLDSKSMTFVAVAYPGLNMLLCRVAKRRGMKVYYMLPPQIWAWGRFRKNLLRRWVDVIISYFPFEADLYRRSGFETILLENPLVRSLSTYRRKRRRERIGFMPGSRRSHIAKNLPVVLELARFIMSRRSDIDLCLLAFDARNADDLRSQQNLVPVFHKNRYQMMKDCDLLVVSSGTASLEAAAMRIPQIFFHRLSLMDDRLLRKFVHVKEFNLANLYYGKKLVTCYITSDACRLEQQLKDALNTYL